MTQARPQSTSHSSQAVRLLVAEQDENAAESLIASLRNASFTLRTQFVGDERGLRAALQRQAWDMLILHADSALGTLANTVPMVREFDHALPVLLLDPRCDASRTTQALRDGAHDAMNADDRERLLLVFRREWDNVRNRSQLARAQLAVDEIDQRLQLLLATSDAGVAYVQEGMHVFANANYLCMFGYADVDELLGATMLDLVPPEAQELLKHYLRDVDELQRAPLPLLCQHVNGNQFHAELTVLRAVYEGEACWQVSVRTVASLAPVGQQTPTSFPGAGPSGTTSKEDDRLTRLRKGIEAFHSSLLASGTPGCIAALQWVNQAQKRGQAGLELCATVNLRMTELLCEAFAAPHRVLNVADDLTLVLLEDLEVENAQLELDDIAGHIASRCSEESRGALEIRLRTVVMPFADELSPDLGVVDELLRRLDRAVSVSAKPQQPEPSSPPPRTEPTPAPGRPFVSFPAAPIPELLDPAATQKLATLVEESLQANSFTLMFQPIISVHGDADELYEVFLYLPPGIGDSATNGQPLSWLELASDALSSGLCGRVDRWLVLQSIKLLSTHRANGHDTRMLVNLSSASVFDTSFPQWLGVAIRAARLPADALVVQINERDILRNVAQAGDFMRALADLHCGTGISHFTGGSNPRDFISRLSVDFVKVDASLIGSVHANPEQRANLGRLIDLLQDCGKLTIVPMVESATLLAALWQAGANYIQGHYLQEPATEMDYNFASEA